ncbi:MAG: triose-phosphate isomerase [Sphingomonadales bacterium]
MKPLIAGNWKMNGLLESRKEIGQLVDNLGEAKMPDCDVVLCLPFTLLFPSVKALTDSPVGLGAQDCHWAESGAHTGNISASMIKETGCAYVIVGHSERRSGHGEHGERSQFIAEKAKMALNHDLSPIICVGESLDEREGGTAQSHVLDQVKKSLPREFDAEEISIAYEPIWAIGTGRTANSGDIAEMHGWIREYLVDHFGEEGNKIRILYGGSVNGGNAKEILDTKNVNGVLVGGASLKAVDFFPIIMAAK